MRHVHRLHNTLDSRYKVNNNNGQESSLRFPVFQHYY